jgi:hypothetical protein
MPDDIHPASETDHGKAIAAAMAKVSDAGSDAFGARLEAIDAIIQGASRYDVMALCAYALSVEAPTCCAEREGRFKTDFLDMLNEAIARFREPDEDEATDDAASTGAAPRPRRDGRAVVQTTLLDGRGNVMKLIPPLKTVLRTAAEPGELVRIRWGEASVLGIATRDSAQNSAVLILDPGSVPTVSTTEPNSTDYILSYGRGYAIHAPSGARFLTAVDPGLEVSGALRVTPERVLICVSFNRMERRFYDIATGEIVAGDSTEKCWAALDWEIRLNSEHDEAPPIFKFSAP